MRICKSHTVIVTLTATQAQFIIRNFSDNVLLKGYSMSNFQKELNSKPPLSKFVLLWITRRKT